MPLTNLAIQRVKPADRPQKLFDEKGLFLLVAPRGSKLWRFKYRFAGKEKLLSLGSYPEVSLASARARRDDLRKLIASGIDPSAQRQAEKRALASGNENTFGAIALEWIASRSAIWVPDHTKRQEGRLQKHVLPYLGDRGIEDIEPSEIIAVLRRIESGGTPETAARVLSIVNQICRYAIQTARLIYDPSANLRGVLAPAPKRHLAAITTPEKIGPLLVRLQEYAGSPSVEAALKLAPILFVRPGELRQMRWAHLNLETAEWQLPLSKTQQELMVPLPRQAVEILKSLQSMTGHSVYVFPNARSATRPMSENAVLAALRSLDISADETTAHGFRAMARTVLDEVLGFRPDIIEHQLGHTVRDPLGRAYNRTTFINERRTMMQAWADYLDTLLDETTTSSTNSTL
jgi:integrase